jgi:outer membrane protein OmpA-like peptidoglycan-associated protein/uncharacterized protein YidB (DUF937 family)
METLDLLEAVETRLGISSDRARSLLSSLVSFINSQAGGLSGVLDRFRQAGLGDTISSWTGSGSIAKAITPDRLQSVLGGDAISDIASKAGVTSSMAASAAAMMLPSLVQKFTSGGVVPSQLPTTLVSSLNTGVSSIKDSARQTVAVSERRGLSPFVWTAALLLILGILALTVWRGVRGSFDPDAQVRLASEKASTALSALKPGAPPQEIVQALNLFIINFDSGSSQLPNYSYGFLTMAAHAINAAPAGTVIEIDGHTDDTGDDTANQALSQQRADAVKTYLVQQGVPSERLATKGYGATKPVADNNSAEGRFHNRRIEFVVLK